MRFLPLLILLLPCLVDADDCGDCSEVHKQVERERLRDAQLHGCRSCKKLVTNEDGCPPFGYECRTDFAMTINPITSTNQCIETRCAGPIAKLAVGGKIVTKVRCNNTQWTNGVDPAAPAVCAMPCNDEACTSSHPDAPPDFSPLRVTPADENTESSCAVGDCQYGKVAIAADGSLKYALNWLGGVPEVECTGDGEWVYGAQERNKYVMCNRLGCGPLKCPAFIFGQGMTSGAVVPLTIKGMGSECAVATCVAGYYSMSVSGEVGVALVNPSLVCGTDGQWHNGGNSYPFVMCAPPPCPNNCDESPVESSIIPTTNPAIRTGCSYSCPDDEAMFRLDSDGFLLSIEEATCESGMAGSKYRISTTSTADQIGCWRCDMADKEFTAAESEVKPQLTQCVLWCPDGFIIEYSPFPNEPTTRVHRLHRKLNGASGLDPSRPAGNWWNLEKNEQYLNSIVLACVRV